MTADAYRLRLDAHLIDVNRIHRVAEEMVRTHESFIHSPFSDNSQLVDMAKFGVYVEIRRECLELLKLPEVVRVKVGIWLL